MRSGVGRASSWEERVRHTRGERELDKVGGSAGRDGDLGQFGKGDRMGSR